MGLSVGVLYSTIKDAERGEITKCVPETRYCEFPWKLKKAAYSLILEVPAFPMRDIRNQRVDIDMVYWWTDAQMLPNDDTSLFLTAGVFEPRTNHVWLTPRKVPNGRIVKLELDRERLGGEIFSYTRMANYPKLQMHPSGQYIGYTGLEGIKTETTKHEEVFHKHKDLRSCNYRFISFAPNGKLMAIILSASRQFELMISMVDKGSVFYDKAVDLSKMFQGFNGNNYNEHVECKWSSDSQYIAVCSSTQYLFVLNKDLEKVVDIVVDILPEQIFPSWASTFDFDPRSFHQLMVVGANDRCLYFLNLDQLEIIEQTDELGRDALDCVRYHPFGKYVAVGTRNLSIYFVDTRDATILYQLDMRLECPDISQQLASLPNLIRLSFSTTGEQLIVATSDGKARIYQMPTELSLFNMCKWKILTHVPQIKLKQLPLPQQIISKLYALPILE